MGRQGTRRLGGEQQAPFLPEEYLPQFDGYCAYGIAKSGKKYKINPTTFDIVDGKLYLFFDNTDKGKKINTLLPWKEETATLQEAAHANWERSGNSRN